VLGTHIRVRFRVSAGARVNVIFTIRAMVKVVLVIVMTRSMVMW
jgi:hypothetical protein